MHSVKKESDNQKKKIPPACFGKVDVAYSEGLGPIPGLFRPVSVSGPLWPRNGGSFGATRRASRHARMLERGVDERIINRIFLHVRWLPAVFAVADVAYWSGRGSVGT